MRHVMRALGVMATVVAALSVVQSRIHSAGSIQEENLQQPASGDWYVNIARPGRPVTMAIPDFEVGTPDAADAGKTLSEVVWNDMEFASIYRLIPKRLYTLAANPADARKIDFYQ